MTQEKLEIGQITVDPRAIEILVQSLSRGNVLDKFRTGFREAFQNALDATLKQQAVSGAGDIEIRIEGEDVVIRDYGIGLRPSEINSLILKLFGTGKEEGLGGFGAGAMSVLFSAPEVIFRSKKEGIQGVEYRRGWLGHHAPRYIAEDFARGTEIRMAGVIGQDINKWAKIKEEDVKHTIMELLATSDLPSSVNVTLNGERITPAFELGPGTLKRDGEIEEFFPGAILEHHIVLLPPAEERPPYLKPRTIIRLGDPAGNNWGLTQWSEYLDDSLEFMHVVQVQPTVRPEHPDYPFNPERAAIANEAIREAVQKTKMMFITDRQTAMKQQTWKKFVYMGTDDKVSDPSSTLHKEARSQENMERLDHMMSAISTLLPSEVLPVFERKFNAHNTFPSESNTETIAQSIAGEPTLVMLHSEWKKKEWMSAGFDPSNPESIKGCAPILTAIRSIGRAVRAMAAKKVGYPYDSSYLVPPCYGFIFADMAEAMFEKDPGSPTGELPFILVNIGSEALRTARTPEALCDMLIARLIHEHVHERALSHNEDFTTLYGAIDDHVSNIRSSLHEIFKISGAWESFREIQGLSSDQPKKRGRKRVDAGLLPMDSKVLGDTLLSEKWSTAASQVILHIAGLSNSAMNKLEAAVAVSELLEVFQSLKIFTSEEIAKLSGIAKKLGTYPTSRYSKLLKNEEWERLEKSVIDFQYRALAAVGKDHTVKSKLSLLMGEYPYGDRVKEIFKHAYISLPKFLEVAYLAEEATYGYGDYAPYKTGIDALLGGGDMEQIVGETCSAIQNLPEWRRPEPLPSYELVKSAILLGAIAKGREAPQEMTTSFKEIFNGWFSEGKFEKRQNITGPKDRTPTII